MPHRMLQKAPGLTLGGVSSIAEMPSSGIYGSAGARTRATVRLRVKSLCLQCFDWRRHRTIAMTETAQSTPSS